MDAPTRPMPRQGHDAAAPSTPMPSAAGAAPAAASRRRFLGGARVIALAAIGCPTLAAAARVLPAMTEGPFYPSRRWRDA
ncbi:MAG: hypothetical protein KDF63_03050, partial [Rhodoferax sp.]|nr:hypothetical protein [Rhodoferax sp.]